jgi:DNA-binding response OmpR family regulator
MLSEMNHQQRILIIDDDVDGLRMLEGYLRARFEVHPALGAEIGLKDLAQFKPHVFLLDIDMRGIDGFEACRAIRASEGRSDIQILFMSANGQAQSMQMALSLGANDYLVKPVRLQELLQRIELPKN